MLFRSVSQSRYQAVMSGVLKEADKEANAEYVDDFIPSLAKLDLKKIKQVTTV